MNGGVAGTTTETVKAPNITVIDDKRCSDCNTQQFVDQLKALPFLATSEIEVKDFSDAGSEEMLKASGLTKLPAIIFEHNKINDYSFLQYLKATLDGKYSLDTGAKFDPYAKRSDRGFFVLAE